MFGYQVNQVFTLNVDGSYSQLSVIEKGDKQYCVASSSYRYIGAMAGTQWEIITDEDDYSPCIASDLVLSEDELFTPRYEYRLSGLLFSSYQEMVEYWNANSKQIGSRNSSNGVELVFSL